MIDRNEDRVDVSTDMLLHTSAYSNSTDALLFFLRFFLLSCGNEYVTWPFFISILLKRCPFSLIPSFSRQFLQNKRP